MTRLRLLAAATAIAAATMIGAPQAGQAAPVDECTSVMAPTQGQGQGQGCTLDLAPGDRRIRIAMDSVTGTYVLRLSDSAGTLIYDARCEIAPTHGECSASFGSSDEAKVRSSYSGTINLGVTHRYDLVIANLSKGGTASLEAGPGTGAVTLVAF